jgi:hypothetical protein
MSKKISFVSIEQTFPMCVEFTLIEPGEPMPRGFEGVADIPKVVCESFEAGSTGGQLKIVACSTIGLVSGQSYFAPFIGSTLSKDDAMRLGNWARAHLQRLASAGSPSAVEPALKVSVLSNAGSRFARIQAEGKDLSVLLSDSVPAADSLRSSAAEWRHKAQRFNEMAMVAEAASRLI